MVAARGCASGSAFCLFGALLAVLLRGLSNDVYFQIGLTMLVALAAKNAILIFEFAVLNRKPACRPTMPP
jgi:multidrug efflux pump subunit AcrB